MGLGILEDDSIWSCGSGIRFYRSGHRSFISNLTAGRQELYGLGMIRVWDSRDVLAVDSLG